MAILRKTLSVPGGGDSVTFGETQDVRSLPGVRAEAAGACVGRGTYGVWIELSEGRRWNCRTLACDNGSNGPAARCSGGVGCVVRPSGYHLRGHVGAVHPSMQQSGLSGCQVGVHADVLRQYHYVHSIRSTFASQTICR